MPVIPTKQLFESDVNRAQQASQHVATIFPHSPPQAIEYELLQQGLLPTGTYSLPFDAWAVVSKHLHHFMYAWDGPDSVVYLLPIIHGSTKNGVSYPNGICLFISPHVTKEELRALFVHEYHHRCRRHTLNEPPTLLDSLLMEGLAEYAVAQLYGEQALSAWTTRYSLADVHLYWDAHFVPNLQLKGLHAHRPFLFGDEQTFPPWIGYCTGYRIVEAYVSNHGPIDLKETLQIRAETLLEGAGF